MARRSRSPSPSSTPHPEDRTIAEFRHVGFGKDAKTLIQFVKLDKNGKPFHFEGSKNVVGDDPIYLDGHLTKEEALEQIAERESDG